MFNMALRKPTLGLIFFLHFFIQAFTIPYDATLIPGSRGKDVADAVLRHITSSGIFPEDHSFLIRLAYVESKFGMDPNTYSSEYFGGLWQVDEPVFISTQSNHPELVRLREQIQDKLGIDWNQANWKNLEIPLYSGLAAALHFTSIFSVMGKMPDTISRQGELWKKYYRPGEEVQRFVNESHELREKTTCRGKMDLCIVLDSSGSIGTDHYELAKNFTAQLIQSFTLDYNRIGMLVYSADTPSYKAVVDVFPMRNQLTIAEMSNLAMRAPYLNDGTRTDLGIYRAVEMFNELDTKDDGDGIPRLLFVFTDGNSNSGSDMPGAVNAIKLSGLTPVSVGIGSGIKREELDQIALHNPKRVFMLGDFVALQDFLYQITTVACETPQTVTEEKEVEDVIVKDEKRLYEIKLPPEGITVTLNNQHGKVNGYWSYTEPVPSAAIYDGKIDHGTFYIPPPKSYAAKSRKKREATIETETENIPASTVFMAVHGVEEKNNYTLTVEHGDSCSESSAVTMQRESLCYFIAIIISIYCSFK